MSRYVRFELISFLIIALALISTPVFGTVETVTVSPSVLIVGEPITFSGVDVGTISPNGPPNTVYMYIYPGFDCAFTPSHSIAFAITPVSSSATYTGIYNTTLSFPATVTTNQTYPGGWVVANQTYQNGLPAGPYSVSATDTQSSTTGAAGVCKNFTVENSSTAPEFSNPIVVICSVLGPLKPLLLAGRFRYASSRI